MISVILVAKTLVRLAWQCSVIPAKAGIQLPFWVPAFAGTTRSFSVTYLQNKGTLFLATTINRSHVFYISYLDKSINQIVENGYRVYMTGDIKELS